MDKLVLGVDGGGSKTHALLADRAGQILGSGQGPSSNYRAVGFDQATAAIQAALAQAWQQASGLSADPQIEIACLGLAGVDRPDDRVLFGAWAQQQLGAAQVEIVNDAELVLAAGTPLGWGLALIAGTGSICYGASADGQKTRAGGWGYLVGDEGSGYAIGLQAIRLATQAADGRSAANNVLSMILEHWNLTEPEQLIDVLYRQPPPRYEIARLAPKVLQLAEQDDRWALKIANTAARELARLIQAVQQSLTLDQPALALGGGLLHGSPWLQNQIMSHVTVELGPQELVREPARGAVTIAQRLIQQRLYA